MNICVVGTGYVGLVTSAVFADLGHHVWGVDKDERRIESLRQGRITIYEPGISELVAHNLADGRLIFSTDLALGNPQEITLLDLAKRIIELTGSRSPIVFRPLPRDDPKFRRPDISRARQLLGWEPRVDIEEGLAGTLAWFRGKLGDLQVPLASAP